MHLKLTADTSNNTTIRVPNEPRIVTSPSSVPYDTIQINNVYIIDLNSGDQVEGDRNPTSKLLIHLTIHHTHNGDVSTVIHAHTMHTTALSLLDHNVPPVIDEQIQLLNGEIALYPHILPNSEALTTTIIAHLSDHHTIILQHHNMLDYERDAHQTMMVCKTTDRLTHIYLLTLQASTNKPTILPKKAQKLKRIYYNMQTDRTKPLFRMQLTKISNFRKNQKCAPTAT